MSFPQETGDMLQDGLNRRGLIMGGGGLVLASSLGLSGRLAAAPRLGDYPFSLGVAAGDPAPDGFAIWTRLAPRPLDEHGGMPMRPVGVLWEVSEDDRFTRIVRGGEAVARPELARSVQVEDEGQKHRRP